MKHSIISDLLDKLHEWKLQNPGHPRRMTLSPSAFDKMTADADISYFIDEHKKPRDAFSNIPFTVDHTQEEPVIYH